MEDVLEAALAKVAGPVRVVGVRERQYPRHGTWLTKVATEPEKVRG